MLSNVNGPGNGLLEIVVDRYNDLAVLRLYESAGALAQRHLHCLTLTARV